jgi:dTDP-4-amino-4,6-dideoxygalactose transaminase
MAEPIRFHAKDPRAADYPRPRIPVLPVLSMRTFRDGAAAEHPSRFLAPDCVPLSAGRAAIAQALRLAGVGPGDEVLIPGYHCGSMIDPVLWLGAAPVFFDVRPDLCFDVHGLAARVTPRSRALIAPHFFGFPQPLEPLLALKARQGFTLIEDCAHALFGADGPHVLGARGDFAISSTCKWFPAVEGGLLCANPPADLDARLSGRRASTGAEARALLGVLQEATGYGRLPLIRPVTAAADWTSRSTRTFRRNGSATAASAAGQLRWLQPQTVDQLQSRITSWILRHAAHHAAAERRRANYALLLAELAGLRRARPLHALLPDGVVPYMFPMLLDEPAADFPALKQRGVPIWRWEELAESDCAQALDYRLRLIQIPCHQELGADELAWLVAQLREVLT